MGYILKTYKKNIKNIDYIMILFKLSNLSETKKLILMHQKRTSLLYVSTFMVKNTLQNRMSIIFVRENIINAKGKYGKTFCTHVYFLNA